jgi:hypothetical protein
LRASVASRPKPSKQRVLDALEVQADPSFLILDQNGRPQISSTNPLTMAETVVLEPILRGRRWQLLILTPSDHRLRVNGQPLPPVSLLDVKDQLQVGEHLLHVTLLSRPSIGPPPHEAIGKECPVCRVAFTAETTVYVCPGCSTPMHCEGPERLECVHLSSECPVCNAPVVMEQGYSYLPEVNGV